MEIGEIGEYCKVLGDKIAKNLMEKYDSADFEVDSLAIEKELYEASLSYSNIFIFESNHPLSDKNKKDLIFIINTRYKIRSGKLKKMRDVELLAHVIKLYVVRNLEKHGMYFI